MHITCVCVFMICEEYVCSCVWKSITSPKPSRSDMHGWQTWHWTETCFKWNLLWLNQDEKTIGDYILQTRFVEWEYRKFVGILLLLLWNIDVKGISRGPSNEPVRYMRGGISMTKYSKSWYHINLIFVEICSSMKKVKVQPRALINGSCSYAITSHEKSSIETDTLAPNVVIR